MQLDTDFGVQSQLAVVQDCVTGKNEIIKCFENGYEGILKVNEEIYFFKEVSQLASSDEFGRAERSFVKREEFCPKIDTIILPFSFFFFWLRQKALEVTLCAQKEMKEVTSAVC